MCWQVTAVRLAGQNTVFCGLSDGNVHAYRLDSGREYRTYAQVGIGGTDSGDDSDDEADAAAAAGAGAGDSGNEAHAVGRHV